MDNSAKEQNLADNSRWLVLAAVFIARTSMGYQFQSIGSIGPILVIQLAIDFAVLGSLIGVYKLPGLFLAIPSGFLGNRFGEKTMLVLGMSMMALGGFATALSDVYSVVYLGRAVSGAGAVLFNVLSAKMIADWFADKELTLAMAIHVNSWPFGIAIGLVTQAALAEVLSISAMLSITAMFCAVGVVLLLLGTQDRTRPAANVQTALIEWNMSLREFTLVSLAALIWLLFNANLILVVSFAPAYLTALGLDVAIAGQLTSIGTWLGVITIPLGGLIAQRWVSGDAFMTSMFVIGSLATFAIFWFNGPLLAFIAFGVFAWAPAGSIVALPVTFLDQANRAIGMGLFFSYYYLGIGVFPAIAGYLRDASDDPSAPINLAAWLLVGALGCLLALRVCERLAPTNRQNAKNL
jgi:predicted MFS family arabinose efflux permease